MMDTPRRRSRPRLMSSAIHAVALALFVTTEAFQPPLLFLTHRPRRIGHVVVGEAVPTSCTSLYMVFDFFKKASTDATEQMNAIATGLAKSRNQFLYSLEDSLASLSSGGLDGGGNLLDNLEDTLLQADLGLATTEDVLAEARFLREESTEIFSRDDVKALLRGKLLEALGTSGGGNLNSDYNRVRARAKTEVVNVVGGISNSSSEDIDNNEGSSSSSSKGVGSFALQYANANDDKPIGAKRPLTVHFIMGANGMGKTTTIGKLAYRLKNEAKQKVLLAACDTFRAGAVAQLEQWAIRAGVDCHSPTDSANGPSAVLYSALDKAIDEDYDILLVDTSGRLSNNDALTAELVKMKRVIRKRMSTKFDENIKPVPNDNVPHETLLVIDAAQGRMALDSAKQWDKELGLTGLILTKLDGSAKGGSVVAVSRELGLPVKLVGIGEGIEDLKDVSVNEIITDVTLFMKSGF